MSHEITACRRKWQLMKSPRSRSHRQRELGSEILNTKSHFWFGSWWNSEPKLQNVGVHVRKQDRLWQDRGRVAVCGPADSSRTPCRRRGHRGGGGGAEERNEDVEVLSCIQKTDWPILGLIKSQGWRCTSADIINIKMIMAQQFGWAEPNQSTSTVWNTHICILTMLSWEHVHY